MTAFPGASLAYPTLKPFALKPSVVYGPIATRRKGRSLGINLLPARWKVCNFNCVYCQLGWNPAPTVEGQTEGHPYPEPSAVREEVDRRFAELAASGDRPDTIVLSGNGEPTLYPAFPEAVEAVLGARDRHLRDIPVEVLTNGTRLADAEVSRALRRLDRVIVKLDAGTRRGQARVDLPVERDFDLDRLTDWAAATRGIIVQAMFLRGAVDNTGEAEVEAWIDRLARIHPRLTQIYSLDRIPPAPRLEQVPREALEAIARRARERTGLEVEVY
ncbi:MAG: radical SAM protein [Planctomycetes bacterium]|nr:radical SAM protein [Planctomycetota bacterium]